MYQSTFPKEFQLLTHQTVESRPDRYLFAFAMHLVLFLFALLINVHLCRRFVIHLLQVHCFCNL